MSDHTDPQLQVKLAPTEYLYGVNPTWFIDMKYEEVLVEKVKLAKQQAKSLFKQQTDALSSDIYLEYEYWLNNVYKAIEHNEKLLKELNQYKEKK